MDILKNHIPGIQKEGYDLQALTLKSLKAADLTVVDTVAKRAVGTRGRDASGNEYIYLKGVASTTANTWVSFDENFETSLLTSDAVGGVAIAMAATVASRWGWYQVYGEGSGKIGNTTSGDKALYISSVTGSVDDLLVTGDKIIGAFSRSTSSVTGAAITVQLNYPFVDNATT